TAEHLFMATGKRNVRGVRRRAPMRHWIGFKRHIPLASSFAEQKVILVPFSSGYLGVQPVAPGLGTLCLAARYEKPPPIGEIWKQIMRENPLLARLGADGNAPPRPLAIAEVPYGFLRARSTGPFWLGDQAAVVPSFTGTGIGVALRS